MQRLWRLVTFSTLALVGTALLGPAAPRAELPDVLKISAIPDENPNELLRIYMPFAEYLSRELAIKVKFTPVVDYAATVEGLAAKKLDLVWYGGFTSVQAVRRTNGTAKRLVLRQEDAESSATSIPTASRTSTAVFTWSVTATHAKPCACSPLSGSARSRCCVGALRFRPDSMRRSISIRRGESCRAT
jgi:ABC-type phosphate/phosphonate transport system substrate-binding protein